MKRPVTPAVYLLTWHGDVVEPRKKSAVDPFFIDISGTLTMQRDFQQSAHK